MKPLLIALLLLTTTAQGQSTAEVQRQIDAAKREQAQREANQRAEAQRQREAAQRLQANQAKMATLIVRTDADCTLTINGDDKGRLSAGRTQKVSVPSGEQLIECTSTEVSSARAEVIKALEAGSQSVLVLELASELSAARKSARYSLEGEDYIRDSETGLVWTRSDNGYDVNWHQAGQVCAQKGMQLPSANELQALYDASLSGVSCGSVSCKVPGGFRLTSDWFWSATPNGAGEAWAVTLANGNRASLDVSYAGSTRALCVRRS
jgi:hypothetical protein